MQLFHTSPNKIAKVTRGRFGEFMFFSSRVYQMTAGEAVVYSSEINDDQIIDAGSLFYHEDAEKLGALVAEFADRFDVDSDTAEEIISERQQLDGDDSDDSWDVQRFTARAAKLLGFCGVRVTDEQGAAYMIDMTGREAELLEVISE